MFVSTENLMNVAPLVSKTRVLYESRTHKESGGQWGSCYWRPSCPKRSLSPRVETLRGMSTGSEGWRSRDTYKCSLWPLGPDYTYGLTSMHEGFGEELGFQEANLISIHLFPKLLRTKKWLMSFPVGLLNTCSFWAFLTVCSWHYSATLISLCYITTHQYFWVFLYECAQKIQKKKGFMVSI